MWKAFAWISCITLVVGVKNLEAAESPSRVKAMFKELDKDNDKRVSFDEYLGKRPDKEGKERKRFDYADKDNDRKVSISEFRTLIESRK
ncbi:MAG TPA: hypothetical protein VHV77_13965 [Pirellulales bacterium]|jgi:Ca2+-binding EF-hand superfamily protein|nr:hypothetical protein [Pirellulales bacterium]